MTRRDWLILPLYVLAVWCLQMGIWWWGYTATEAVPLDLLRPRLMLPLCIVVLIVWTTVLYLITLHTLRRNPNSRRLGYWMLLAIMLPTLGLALWARLGGPRFQPSVLVFPTQGCGLGWLFGSERWRRTRACIDSRQPEPESNA